MSKNLIKKTLVFGIIILFIGAIITPNICGNTRDINNAIQTNERNPHTMSDIDWWPMFRHDLNHTGYSTSNAPDTNILLWNYKVGESVWSSPAISHQRRSHLR